MCVISCGRELQAKGLFQRLQVPAEVIGAGCQVSGGDDLQLGVQEVTGAVQADQDSISILTCTYGLHMVQQLSSAGRNPLAAVLGALSVVV